MLDRVKNQKGQSSLVCESKGLRKRDGQIGTDNLPHRGSVSINWHVRSPGTKHSKITTIRGHGLGQFGSQTKGNL